MMDGSIKNMPDDEYIEVVGNTQYDQINSYDIDRLISICDKRKAALAAAEERIADLVTRAEAEAYTEADVKALAHKMKHLEADVESNARLAEELTEERDEWHRVAVEQARLHDEDVSELTRERDGLREVATLVIAVGTVFPDDTTERPSVIFGHPNREQWWKIFLKAKAALKGGSDAQEATMKDGEG